MTGIKARVVYIVRCTLHAAQNVSTKLIHPYAAQVTKAGCTTDLCDMAVAMFCQYESQPEEFRKVFEGSLAPGYDTINPLNGLVSLGQGSKPHEALGLDGELNARTMGAMLVACWSGWFIRGFNLSPKRTLFKKFLFRANHWCLKDLADRKTEEHFYLPVKPAVGSDRNIAPTFEDQTEGTASLEEDDDEEEEEEEEVPRKRRKVAKPPKSDKGEHVAGCVQLCIVCIFEPSY